eukprot:c29060_g1_i1 orf=572-3217(-)
MEESKMEEAEAEAAAASASPAIAMAGDSEKRSWADLLHNSTQLLQAATPSAQFPPIQRSLDQLEALSKKLKAKTSRLEAPSQAIAATRLLAREGINAEQLTRDLRSFELKTSFEDVFPVEATTVEEYLQQVHEMIMLSAIQEAQRDNLKNFDDYMMKVLEDDWQREKHDFLNNLSRLPLTPVSVGLTPSTDPTHSLRGQKMGAGLRPMQVVRELESTYKTVLDRKASVYAEVVLRLNAARERGMPFKAATAFKAAFDSVAGDVAVSRSVSMGKIWHLLQCLLFEDIESPGNMSIKMAMVIGARHHLETGHEKYILDTIQSHPVQAVLGGSTGNLNRVRAFLRVRLRDHGVLDFDAQDARMQPPMDTTWHQIYYCLRTGYYNEARYVAQSSRVSRAFAAQLSEWIATGGIVSAATAAAAAEECERMVRTGDRPGRSGYDKKKMLLYAIVSGSRQQVDRLLHDTPTLFSTIEDFLWFNLAVLRDGDDSLSITAEGMVTYTLEDLQSYLLKFDSSYYTKNGKDPLVYPYVLLLSLQLHAAVAHLIRENGSEGYNIDAVHIAVALADRGILLEGFTGAQKLGVMDNVSEIASIIRHYGLSYVRQRNLAIALEYYAQAAAAMGGGAASWNGQGSADRLRQRQMMLKQLLTELLRHDGGIPLLLGSSGTGSEGALRRFLPDHQTQYHFLVDAARQFQDSGLYDKAVELLKRICAFSLALEIVNGRLSECINALARGRMDGETKTVGLILVGNDILEAYKSAGAVSLQERELVTNQQTALRQLETIFSFHKLARNGRYNDCITELCKLSFLSLDARTSERSAEALQNVSATVQACIPDLLKVALTCLDNVSDSDGAIRALKTKIANFVANSLPRNWPNELYERVARIL